MCAKKSEKIIKTARKPKGKPVAINTDEFFQVVQIWEFINTFKDYLQISPFRIEELYAGLAYQMAEDEVPLVREVHTSIIGRYLEDFKEHCKVSDAIPENQAIIYVLNSLYKSESNIDFVWCELVKIVMSSRRYNLLADAKSEARVEKIAGRTGKEYNMLSLNEKIDVLLYLINSMYDVPSLGNFIERMQEKKSDLYKKRNEIYSEIKGEELSKQEVTKKLAMSKYWKPEKKEDIETAEQKEANAKIDTTRTESIKKKKEQDEKDSEFQKALKKLDEIENVIEKKQTKVEKINDEIGSLVLRTASLGRDQKGNEYWYFTNDNTRLFIYKKKANVWFFYDREIEVEKLLTCLNTQNHNESKLNQSLRRIKKYLNLKKEEVPGGQNGSGTKKTDKEKKDEETTKELMQLGMDLEEALAYVNHKKKIKSAKSQTPHGNDITFEGLKQELLDLEERIYAFLLAQNLMWKPDDTRNAWREQANICDDIISFSSLLVGFEECLQQPLKFYEAPADSDENSINTGMQKIVEGREIMNIWTEDFEGLRPLWLEYIHGDVRGLSGVYLALFTFEKVIKRHFTSVERAIKKANEKIKKKEILPPTNVGSRRSERHLTRNLKKTVHPAFREDHLYDSEDIEDFDDYAYKNEKIEKKVVKEEEDTEEEYKQEREEPGRVWEEKCYKCEKYGEVMCCEGCSNVAHYPCLGLKDPPDEEWYCEDCLYRLNNMRMTRSRARVIF